MAALDFHAKELINLKRVNNVTVSPDGQWLAVVVQRLDKSNKSKYIQDIWRLPAQGIGPRVQLTTTEHQDHSPGFDHHGTFLFLSDRPHRDESKPKTQLWCFPPHGGDARRLTDEPLGVNAYMHAKSEDLFVVVTDTLPDIADDDLREEAQKRAEHGPSAILYNKMPVRFWDHWRSARQRRYIVYRDAERLELTPDAGATLNNAIHALSPNGRWLAISHSVDRDDYTPRVSKLLLIDTHNGDQTVILHPPAAWIGGLCFSDDSNILAYTRHDIDKSRYGASVPCTYDITQGKHQAHPYDDDLWFAPAAFSADGTRLFGVADVDGQTAVFSLFLNGQKNPLDRLSEDGGSYHQVIRAHNSDQLFGIYSSFVQPPEAFALTPSETPQPKYLPCPLNRLSWDPQDIHIEYQQATSSDGKACPYYLLKPANHDGAAPTIMWIHGGPIGQWGDIWHWRWNALTGLSRGYVMVLPNPRGSTGLGQQHVEDIWGNNWGGQCFDDLMAVADDLAARNDVMEDHMVAMGGSFGGYMTNWIGTQTDRFCCLISHAGIASMRTFHGVTDSPVWWSHMWDIDPYTDPTPFDRYSPLPYIKQWKSPTLIIHGQQDYRVPVGEALILFDALQAQDIESSLLIFPDENHWILKPNNIIAWYEHVYRFISQHANVLLEHDPDQPS